MFIFLKKNYPTPRLNHQIIFLLLIIKFFVLAITKIVAMAIIKFATVVFVLVVVLAIILEGFIEVFVNFLSKNLFFLCDEHH